MKRAEIIPGKVYRCKRSMLTSDLPFLVTHVTARKTGFTGTKEWRVYGHHLHPRGGEGMKTDYSLSQIGLLVAEDREAGIRLAVKDEREERAERKSTTERIEARQAVAAAIIEKIERSLRDPRVNAVGETEFRLGLTEEEIEAIRNYSITARYR